MVTERTERNGDKRLVEFYDAVKKHFVIFNEKLATASMDEHKHMRCSQFTVLFH